MEEKKYYFRGADISFVPMYRKKGFVFKDVDNKEKDALLILKDHGCNTIRLRLWHTPGNVKESGGYCDLKQTISFARDIKRLGLTFILDFHYSDFWADPEHQKKPKAWENVSGDALCKMVYQYTLEVLSIMKREDVLPDMVQIGNEITNGFLFPDGKLPDYKGMASLINAGLSAVEDLEGDNSIKTIIHLDQGGKYNILSNWMDNSLKSGINDFDILGLSYYPYLHGSFDELSDTLKKLVDSYKKPVFIAETAYPWRLCKNGFIGQEEIDIVGIKASSKGQRQLLEKVDEIASSVPNNMCYGWLYWEPACIPQMEQGGWESNMGIFDESGKVMEAVNVFNTKCGLRDFR